MYSSSVTSVDLRNYNIFEIIKAASRKLFMINKWQLPDAFIRCYQNAGPFLWYTWAN